MPIEERLQIEEGNDQEQAGPNLNRKSGITGGWKRRRYTENQAQSGGECWKAKPADGPKQTRGKRLEDWRKSGPEATERQPDDWVFVGQMMRTARVQ